MAQPPPEVLAEIKQLRTAVSQVVPAKIASNLLVATWNLRAFGGLTEKWKAAAKDSPKRDWKATALIAAVISHFDVIAIQEVKREVTALRVLLDQLGPTWKAIISDATEGEAGNDERIAYLFDTTRVEPSGLVGEIVLPPTAGTPTTQFARTPYAASFARNKTEFILTSVHIIWGKQAASRLPEITAFAQWMKRWADRPSDWNQNLLVLGDFNIDRRDDPLFEAFISTGLWPPPALNTVPRTIFNDDKKKNFYDQIAWFSTESGDSLLTGLGFGRAGHFDFLAHTYPELTKNEVSWRMSDHYPLWVEFTL